MAQGTLVREAQDGQEESTRPLKFRRSAECRADGRKTGCTFLCLPGAKASAQKGERRMVQE